LFPLPSTVAEDHGSVQGGIPPLPCAFSQDSVLMALLSSSMIGSKSSSSMVGSGVVFSIAVSMTTFSLEYSSP
jgi:hypothetical protein